MRARPTPAASLDTVAPAAAEVAPEPAPEPTPEPDHVTEPKGEPEPEPVVEAVAEAEAKPEPAAEPAPEPEPVVEAVAESPAEATAAAEAPEAGAVAASEPAAPEPETEAPAEPKADPAAEPALAAVLAEDDADDDEPAMADAKAKDPAPYAVDDSVLAILREEAEREATARRSEARPLETQPDLGIDAAAPVAAAAAAAAAVAADADGRPSARRDLFPDVEEINSTLRPSEFQVEEPETVEAAPPPPEPRRGFRSGFLTVMAIAMLAAALYIVAPRLGSMVPALEGPLGSYVAAIDGLRLQLDGLMRSATVAINGN
jgi:hypothetical protein